MEPSTTTGRKGSLDNPEIREDVPGHVIPILEREFDDFDNEAEKYLAGDTPETEFIGFRLKQGVYGQRQADVQMCRIKLPWGGITPEQMETFADVVERWAPLNKAHITTRQNIQIHHIPLRDMAELIREMSARRPLQPRGLRQHRPQRDRRPVGGRLPRRAVGPDAVRRRLRALLRAPPHDAADAAQGQDRVHRLRHRPRADRHPRHRLHRPRARRRKGFEIRVGGGTSIMPRIAPTLVDFVTADDGEYLKCAEAVFRIFDRQDWLRVNRARARIKVLVDKFGIEALRAMVDEELQGDWVAERDFSIDHRLFVHDEEANAPRPAGQLRLAERRRHGVRALRRARTSTASARPASPPSRSRSCAAT